MYVYGDAPEPVRKQYDAMGIKPSYTRNLADTELTIKQKMIIRRSAEECCMNSTSQAKN